jgi:hypothetical protein
MGSGSKQHLGPTLCTLLIAWILAPPALCAETGTGTLRLVEGRFLLHDSERPPPDTHPGWTDVQLPDRWDRSRPGQRGIGWYRFEVPPPEDPNTPLALYLPHFNMNAAIWLNGEFAAARVAAARGSASAESARWGRRWESRPARAASPHPRSPDACRP